MAHLTQSYSCTNPDKSAPTQWLDLEHVVHAIALWMTKKHLSLPTLLETHTFSNIYENHAHRRLYGTLVIAVWNQIGEDSLRTLE